MPNDYQAYIHKFVQKYWHLVDVDNSGSLNFDEYKYTMAGFAAVDAGLIIKVIVIKNRETESTNCILHFLYKSKIK